MPVAVRIACGLAGAAVVVGALYSALGTLVLPRGVNGRLVRGLFRTVQTVLAGVGGRRDPLRRDRALALVAPIGLLLLPVCWLLLVWAGYGALFVAAGVGSLSTALSESGSSLLTLGFQRPSGMAETFLAFSEATIGLGLVTLLIAYLPTMYSAFSSRETEVALLEVRAGSPPSAVEMLERFKRIGQDGDLERMWEQWERWFAELDETHTSLAALPLFRSAAPHRSWVTAAGTVLDAAALYASSFEHGPAPRAGLCIRAGYTALRNIGSLYGLAYDPDPAPDDPVAICREEYDAAYDRLAAAGYDMVADRDRAWRDYAGWRVNYDQSLLGLAIRLEVPYAPWSADRSPLLGPVVTTRPRIGDPERER